jgi:hypothetical protein
MTMTPLPRREPVECDSDGILELREQGYKLADYVPAIDEEEENEDECKSN